MAGARLPLSADLEERSLEDVYRTEFAGLMRLAYLMTGSNAVAEDLVHDVFVRVADRIDLLENPAPYLRVAVVNACRHHHRRAMRLTRPASETGDPEPPTADAVAVRQALMAMSARRRAAVVLRFYADLPHEQIADALGCRTATARSLVHRGLEDLRGALDDS